MKQVRVIIPDEMYQLVELKKGNLPAVMVANSALLKFNPKEAFPWHLSLKIKFNKLGNNDMPLQPEMDLSEQFEDRIDAALKGQYKNKPNALFCARIT
ncbi:MAG: DUF695 domain-containing protein [Rickettsiales bacterium]|jgi:hypothetical protein|nr:DUF695 domain-containing protein [Rickettsiales bacterium]